MLSADAVEVSTEEVLVTVEAPSAVLGSKAVLDVKGKDRVEVEASKMQIKASQGTAHRKGKD